VLTGGQVSAGTAAVVLASRGSVTVSVEATGTATACAAIAGKETGP
jgi:hypothetical protein